MENSDLLPVAGFKLAARSAGIKQPGRLDVVLMELAADSTVAAVFTRNAFCAAPVQLARRHLADNTPRYLLVNTGNANAGTGSDGLAAAQRCCDAVASAASSDFEVPASAVLPFSTGVIGEPLPVPLIEAVIPAAMSKLHEDSWAAAAEGILTTDTRPKAASRCITLDGVSVTFTGMAKGAGMLRPNMATMLAYLATDAVVDSALLQRLWTSAVETSFNRITVDGDTSTNDAAILVATGAAAMPALVAEEDARCADFYAALESLAVELAQALVRDGEGASKFVAVRVNGGADESECLEVAYTIAHSPLVKTALFASDPNWGRLLAAIGRAEVDNLDVEKIEVLINGVLIATGGCRAGSYTEESGVLAMEPQEIEIEVRLHRGAVQATVWTSDFSYDYVRINAEYRT